MLNWNKTTDAVKFYLKQVYQPGDLVLSYTQSQTPGIMTPLFVRNAEEIDTIVLNPLCVQNLAVYLSEFNQNAQFANHPFAGKWYITLKPCDIRSFLQMMADEQIKKEQIEMVVFDCDGTITQKNLKQIVKDEIRSIHFDHDSIKVTTLANEEKVLDPKELFQGKCSDNSICSIPSLKGYTFIGEQDSPVLPVKDQTSSFIQDDLSQEECFEKVTGELEKCIRCNACRNICPACFCSDQCIMDKPKLAVPYITKEITLRQILLYHLIRFYHVAPNCTACGECERVCPQGIQLSILYRYLHRMNAQEFGLESGASDVNKQKLLSYRFGEDLV